MLIRQVLTEAYAGKRSLDDVAVSEAFETLLGRLESGELRAAEPSPQGWLVHSWIKEGILVGFRIGRIVEMSASPILPFFDKHNMPTQKIDGVGRRVRIVPGGTAVRRGAHLGVDVIVMPPAYVNVGAYVGSGSMIDSPW